MNSNSVSIDKYDFKTSITGQFDQLVFKIDGKWHSKSKSLVGIMSW